MPTKRSSQAEPARYSCEKNEKACIVCICSYMYIKHATALGAHTESARTTRSIDDEVLLEPG